MRNQRPANAIMFAMIYNPQRKTPVLHEAGVGVLCLLVVVALFGSLATICAAQQVPPAQQQISYEGEKVAFVDVAFRPGIDADALRPLIQQKGGAPYSNQKVQATIAALKQAAHVSRIDLQVTPEPNGLRVTFVLQPAFYIGMIYFPGATKQFSYPGLLQILSYPAQEPYTQSRVTEGQEALQQFFVRSGYFQARVNAELQFDNAARLANIIFRTTLGKPAKIGKIAVQGLPPKQAALIQRSLRSYRARLKGAYLKSGKRYDPRKLQAALGFIRDQLGRENRLASSVRLEAPHYDPETNRADISFGINPGPVVAVRITGARIWKRTLRKLIPIYEESSIDQDLVEEGERNLVSYFQGKGYFDVKVTPKLEDDPAQILLQYQIDKGRKHKVVTVQFVGNHHFSRADLLPQVSVKSGGFLSRGSFNNDLLNRSVRNLTAYYRGAGYEDVKVQPNVVDREPKLYISFEIAEGFQTIVDALNVEGNRTQSIESLAPKGLKLKAGQPYSSLLLSQDRDQIMATYLDLGYLNATFRPTVKRVAPHHVEVTYQVQEAVQTHIASVVNVGGQHTRQAFVDRTTQLETFMPLSQGSLLASESRLYGTGVFDWANVAPREAVTDQRREDVLVKVHEAHRNTITYGFGFALTPRTANLPAGTVSLPGLPVVGLPQGTKIQVTQKQYATPRVSVEYMRRNLRGKGETAAVALLLSRLDQKGSFSYAQPRFRNWNWSSLLSFSAERTSTNPLYTARLGQATAQLERYLDTARTQTLQVRYSFTRTDLTNIPVAFSELVLPQDRSVRLSTVSATYLHDTRDKPLDAHRGIYQSFDFGINPKAIGSSANFGRFLGQTAYYKQMKPYLVWANNVRLGFAKRFGSSTVPLSERFFSGGADSLRGFPLNGAGPQRSVQICVQESSGTCLQYSSPINVPVGGNMLFVLNSEARFPIPVSLPVLGQGLGGVVFYDGGNVYSNITFRRFFNDYSNTLGFGLRYNTPVGPVRLDIGRNLSPVPGLKATQIFVTLGQAF